MSRSGYSDDCENLELYRRAVANAINGSRGQAALREMLAALDAMPVRELVKGALDDGERVCALGCLGRARGLEMDKIDAFEPSEVAHAFGIARCLAAEVAFENDDDFHLYKRDETPAERWTRMRAWVASLVKS